MFSKILVPLDGSEFAEQALVHAGALARCFGATVALTEVVDRIDQTVFVSPPVEYDGAHFNPTWSAEQRTAVLTNPLAARAEEYLAAVARRLRETGLNVEHEVLEGPTAETLLRHLEVIGAGIVVMATHGRGGLARALIGSVADRVSRHAHVPVLLVRPPE